MVKITDHPDYRGLLAAVCAAPGDDLPREVLADWLEEHGQPERSEFIRVQCELARMSQSGNSRERVDERCSRGPNLEAGCECRGCVLRRRERELWHDYANCGRLTGEKLVGSLTWFNAVDLNTPSDGVGCYAAVRRGFVAEVHCRLADWCGGECGHSEHGSGCYYGIIPLGDASFSCPACHGTGRTPGIGESVVAHHPVETVRVTNKAPTETGSGWAWWRHTGLDDTDILPVEVFDRLPDADAVPFAHGERLCFSTREDAFTALSTACLLLARSRGKMKRPDGVLETPHRA